jgi:hypothetical protein
MKIFKRPKITAHRVDPRTIWVFFVKDRDYTDAESHRLIDLTKIMNEADYKIFRETVKEFCELVIRSDVVLMEAFLNKNPFSHPIFLGNNFKHFNIEIGSIHVPELIVKSGDMGMAKLLFGEHGELAPPHVFNSMNTFDVALFYRNTEMLDYLLSFPNAKELNPDMKSLEHFFKLIYGAEDYGGTPAFSEPPGVVGYTDSTVVDFVNHLIEIGFARGSPERFLYNLVKYDAPIGVFEVLHKLGLDFDTEVELTFSDESDTLMNTAVKLNNVRIVEFLIMINVDINKLNKEGLGAKATAVKHKRNKILELLQNSDDPD